MTGKTHLAIGTASALCIAQPSDFKEMALCVAMASIGSVISDVDVKSSESSRDLTKITSISVVAGIIIAFLEYYFNLGIINNLSRESILFKLLLGFSAFIAICTFGKNQPHRSFMHSIPALIILTSIVYFISPMLSLYFMISMLSHIIIDLLNMKRVRLFYPFKRGFCFRLCKASGIVNNIAFFIGSAVTACFILLNSLKIIGILH